MKKLLHYFALILTACVTAYLFSVEMNKFLFMVSLAVCLVSAAYNSFNIIIIQETASALLIETKRLLDENKKINDIECRYEIIPYI